MNVNVHLASKPKSIMIDTGANVTVFCQAQYFSHLKSIPTNAFIRFGPSTPFRIEGEGTVHFCITDMDSVVHDVRIEHVMYVPKQPHNIVSLKSLRAQGCGANFDHPPFHIRW
jgi:hypothetical protein